MKLTKLTFLLASTIYHTTCVAQEFDPFAIESSLNQSSKVSNLTASADYIFQGTYIPELRLESENDFYEQVSTLDGLVNYDINNNSFLRVRGMMNFVNQETNNNHESSNKSLALEYFYQGSFGNKHHYVSFGRKHLGWSTGFQWRPADVIANGFTTKNFDSLDPSRYTGIDQLQYEWIGKHLDVSALISTQDHDFYNGEQLAIRLGIKDNLDMSLLFAQTGDYGYKYGVTYSANLPLATTLAVEAVHVDIDKHHLLSANYFGSTLESLSGTDEYQDVYIGLTKFIDDKQRFNLEYFHNGRGFKEGRLDQTINASVNKYRNLGFTSWHLDQNLFEREYLGRNYLYGSYTGFLETYQLQIKPSLLVNLDDDSYIASLTLKRAIGDNSELLMKANFYDNQPDTDLGEISNGIGFNLSYLLHIF